MTKAVNIAHPTQKMGTCRRAGQRERHGFLQAVIGKTPAGGLAGIGGGQVGAIPDAVAGSEPDLIGIKWTYQDTADPMWFDGAGVRRAERIPLGIWKKG